MSRNGKGNSSACGGALSRRNTLAGLAIVLGASGMLMVSGCGVKNGMNLGGPPIESEGVTISGTVHGGQQPVSGATVFILANSPSGYGTAPTTLLTTTTDAGGSFSFPIAGTCSTVGPAPHAAQPNDQLIIMSVGGNPGNSGGTVNPNLVLISAIGSCSSLSGASFFQVNEVTTVASAYALAGFLTYSGAVDTPPSSSVTAGTIPFFGIPTSGGSCTSAAHWTSTGANTCNYVGLSNAARTVQTLVNVGTGLPPANSKVASYTAAGITAGNDSYVPSSRINTLANILSSCVNSTGGAASDGGTTNCGTLFIATTPTTIATPVAPTDTLQAILNVAQSPFLATAANTSFFGLASKNAPFNTPAGLTSKPNDWALAVGYTSGGATNINAGDAGTIIPSGATQATILEGLAIDQQGNVWATSTADQTGSANGGNGGIVGLTNQGTPISPNATAANFGAFQTNSFFPFSDPAVDESGNIYFGNAADNSIAAISPSGGSVLSNVVVDPAIDGNGYTAIAVDQSDHLFVSGLGSGGNMSFGEYTGSTEVWSNTTAGTSATIAGGFSGASLDASGHVWFSTASLDQELTASTGALVKTWGLPNEGNLAVDSTGNVYGCNTGSVYKDSGSASSIYNQTGGCYTSTNFAPVAIDGLGNLWMPVLGTAESPGSGAGHLDEVATTGTNAGKTISPATFGYQGIGVPGSFGGSDGEGAVYLVGQGPYGTNAAINGTAIDGSGNVWVLNGQPDQNAASHQFIEFIGIAAPAVTPKALAAQFNTFSTLP
ncbi:MAG TPA: hypothetical protein VKB38_10690 [Terracidiphilus sp.]|nr:hypothetical protein [Terracidiphilus sp.]